MNDLQDRLKHNYSVFNFKLAMIFMVLLAVLSLITVAVLLDKQSQRAEKAGGQSEILIQQSNQNGEILICLFAIHLSPEELQTIIPGANTTKCRAKLSTINNDDGTFAGREQDGQGTFTDPSKNSTITQPAPQPTQQPGSVKKIIDGVTNLVPGL